MTISFSRTDRMTNGRASYGRVNSAMRRPRKLDGDDFKMKKKANGNSFLNVLKLRNYCSR